MVQNGIVMHHGHSFVNSSFPPGLKTYLLVSFSAFSTQRLLPLPGGWRGGESRGDGLLSPTRREERSTETRRGAGLILNAEKAKRQRRRGFQDTPCLPTSACSVFCAAGVGAGCDNLFWKPGNKRENGQRQGAHDAEHDPRNPSFIKGYSRIASKADGPGNAEEAAKNEWFQHGIAEAFP